MSMPEFRKWQAMDILDPIGDARRIEIMLGRVCLIMHNAWAGSGSRAELKDFVPDYMEGLKPVVEMTDQDEDVLADKMLSVLNQYNRTVGGTELKARV